jgi:hypothetical protein
VHEGHYRIDGESWQPVDHPVHGMHYEGPWWTIDMVATLAPEKGERNGSPKLAYYSSKTALLPTLVAGVYYVVWKVGDGLDNLISGEKDRWRIAYPVENRNRDNQAKRGDYAGRTILILINVVPFVIFLYLYRRMLAQSSYRPVTRVICLATAALGTFITAYTRTLNNHTVAAICGFIAVYAVLRIWYGGERRWWYFTVAGFFAAFTATCELPATSLLAAIMLVLLIKDPKRAAIHALPAAVVPIVAFAMTNYLSVGQHLNGWAAFAPPQVFHHVDESADRAQYRLYHFPGSYWNKLDPTGIDGQEEHKAVYTAHTLIGHHGIFSLTPILLLSLVGIGRHLMGKTRSLVGFNAIVLLITLVVLVFYVVKTNNYSGGAQGFRWSIWMIPLWLVALPQGVELFLQRRWTQTLTMVLFALSVFTAAHATVGVGGPWSKSWLHWALQAVGIVNYS